MKYSISSFKTALFLHLMAVFVLLPLYYGSMILLDSSVFLWAKSLPSVIRDIAEIATKLGESDKFLVPFALCAIFLYSSRRFFKQKIHRYYAVCFSQISGLFFAIIALTGLENLILKFLAGRARPKFFESEGAFSFHPFSIGYNYNSFPSGHTTTALAFFIILIFMLPRYRILWIFCAILASFSRIILTAHYFTDVCAALIISGTLTWLLVLLAAHAKYCFTFDKNGSIKMRYKFIPFL